MEKCFTGCLVKLTLTLVKFIHFSSKVRKYLLLKLVCPFSRFTALYSNGITFIINIDFRLTICSYCLHFCSSTQILNIATAENKRFNDSLINSQLNYYYYTVTIHYLFSIYIIHYTLYIPILWVIDSFIKPIQERNNWLYLWVSLWNHSKFWFLVKEKIYIGKVFEITLLRSTKLHLFHIFLNLH